MKNSKENMHTDVGCKELKKVEVLETPWKTMMMEQDQSDHM